MKANPARNVAAHYVLRLRADPKVLAELRFRHEIEAWLLERFAADVDHTPDALRPVIRQLAPAVRQLLKRAAGTLGGAARRAARRVA
jgi:hypothetical protein